LKKILGLVALLMLSGCSPHPHDHYSQMYTDDKGDYYAKTYDHGEYIWWLYVATANQPSPSWTAVSSPSSPSSLNAVRSVAVLQNGRPTQVVDEKDVPPEDIENEETPSEATESNQSESTTESTGETSSDSGSSGGDSGGGGDGGGGGD